MTGKISAFSFLISFVLAGLLRVLFIIFCPLGGKYKFSLVSPFLINPKDFDVPEPELVDLDNSGQKKLLLTLYCTFTKATTGKGIEIMKTYETSHERRSLRPSQCLLTSSIR